MSLDLTALAPRTLTETRIVVGARASGGEIAIPLVIARGAAPGPCLWISGQVHGDELNGVFAALDFVRGLPLDQLSGTVIVSATANPLALDGRQRRTPQDALDLDQSFPGHAAGSATERMAAAFHAAVLAHADAFVSLHTTMAGFDAEVFAAYKAPRDERVAEALMLRCIAQFRPAMVCLMPEHARPADSTGVTAGSIDYQLLGAGKLAIMVELGGGGWCDRAAVRQGVEGLTGTARLLGLLPGAAAAPGPMVKVTEFRALTTGAGGLFRPDLPPGATIHPAGTGYGTVIDLYGRTIETASCPRPYRLIATRRAPAVDTGDRLAIAAVDWAEIVPGRDF